MPQIRMTAPTASCFGSNRFTFSDWISATPLHADHAEQVYAQTALDRYRQSVHQCYQLSEEPSTIAMMPAVISTEVE